MTILATILAFIEQLTSISQLLQIVLAILQAFGVPV